MTQQPPALSWDELAKHASQGDCWIALDGLVYDVSQFAPEHPGGAGLVYDVAGSDGTAEFVAAHPLSTLRQTLGTDGLAKIVRGRVDGPPPPRRAAAPKPAGALPQEEPKEEPEVPPLAGCLNLLDFEAIAERVLRQSGRKQAFDNFSSGGDDEITLRENLAAWQRVWLRPRVLVDVKEVDLRTSLLGAECSFPVYLSSVAMLGMGHPDGELSWVRAAHKADVLNMIPCYSSKPFEQIAAAAAPGQPNWFQMYVHPDRSVVTDQVRACEAAGIRALCITVDSAMIGKRERDLRNKLAQQLGQLAEQKSASGAVRKAGAFANRDASLNWSDVKWFIELTSMKIVLKGVQCGPDAVLAARSGAAAIILSNHGGRNLDRARSGLEVLPEVMAALRAEGLQDAIEVYVDGGIRRGGDVVTALALGAKAVGLGKPAVYAMSCYGEEGVVRMLQILKEETLRCMRLIGAASVADLCPEMVDARALNMHPSALPPPPSPYALAPDNQIALLRKEVAALAAQVHKLQSPVVAVPASPGIVAGLGWTLVSIARSVMLTVVGASVPAMLHRSAVFLVVFLVVHMLGNLSFLASDDAFNQYGHKLEALRPATTAIELYLLAAAVIHAGTAMLASWRKRSALLKPKGRWGLALSSIAVTAFMIVHVAQFRFGPGVKEGYSTTVAGSEMRDLARLQREVFSDPAQVGFYLLALGAIGTHVWLGWAKAVPKLAGLPSEHRANALLIGQAMTVVVVVGFAAGPLSALSASPWMQTLE